VSEADDGLVREGAYEATVRSYELDSYLHLNNAVYQSWFEEGREALLRRGGTDFMWWPRETGLWFVLARIEIDFRRSAEARDRVAVRSRLASFGEKSVVWRQAMFRVPDGALLAEARALMCFGQDGRAVPLPPEFRARYAPHPSGDAPFGAA